MSDKLLYKIRILIIHPTFTSDEISDALDLNPNRIVSVGQPRQTPKGTSMPGVWPDTRWSVQDVRNGDRYFFRRLDEVLDRFGKYRDFLRRIAETGGETNFIIEVPGGENIGDVLTEQSVAKLADLKGSLGVEVYPHMNPRENEYIWNADYRAAISDTADDRPES